MSNYRISFEKSVEIVVKADSYEEASQAANILSDYDISDMADSWEIVVFPTSEEPDHGILDGDIVAIEDMPTEEELLENETEDERYQREYCIGDPRQLAMEVA